MATTPGGSYGNLVTGRPGTAMRSGATTERPGSGEALQVALVQMAVEDGRPQENMARALEMLASADPADVYLLPELWTTGYAHKAWDEAADSHTPTAVDRLGAEAQDRSAWIGGSLVSRRPDGRLANRFWLHSPTGDVTAAYDKTHLFGPMGETDRLAPGSGRVRAVLGPWTAGLSLCYDLRFPGMYREDALDGANLFLVASEWPEERKDVLKVLARSRAAENQAYVALCNRTGSGGGTVFGGGSMLVGPDGEIVCETGGGESVVTGSARLDLVETARRAIPVLEDNRPEQHAP